MSNFKKMQMVLMTFFLIVMMNNCKKKFEIYRFIDHLEKENIISSPLINLEENLEIVEQEWPGNEMFPLELNERKVMAFPTQMPILWWKETEKPEHMRIFRNGVEIEFSNHPIPKSFTWKWKKIEEDIEPAIYKGFKTYIGAIILPREKYFVSRDVFLPEGNVTFEITARSEKQLKYLPYLELYLNDQLFGVIPVGKYQKYKFSHKIPSGYYKVKVGFSKVSQLDSYQEKEHLLLDQIYVRSDKDLILISSPAGHKRTSGNNIYKAVYYAKPIRKIIDLNNHVDFQKRRSQFNLILNNNESLSKEVILDSGLNVFEIVCYSKSKDSFLSLWLDDKEIGRQSVIPWRQEAYLFSLRAIKGRHQLKIKFYRPKKKVDRSMSELSIQSISIVSLSKDYILSLYRIKNNYRLYDLDAGDNSYLIKKKLEYKDYSINALFAPPESVFMFKLTIPKSGFMEFGYGILDESFYKHSVESHNVRFSIIMKYKKNRKVLFSRNINLDKYREDIRHERIDLTPYQGKKAILYFITEDADIQGRNYKKISKRIEGFPFWYNPVIFQKREKRDKKNVNVILISIDTLRADHLSCYGYERDTSPNIDKLSQEGVLFTNNFSPTPSTLPSHLSMLTSLYPVYHGICSQRPGIILKLNPSIPTLGDILRRNNYFTGAFTGGAYVSAKFGFSKGFDFYYEDRGSTARKYSAWKLFKYTSNWLEKNQDKKFFLFLHTYQVHAPYYCPEPYNLMYLNKNAKWKEAHMREILGYGKYTELKDDERENLVSLYDGEIRYTDEFLIKPLIEELKRLSLYDNTMIILTSDHGEEFYEHRGWLHEHSLYNELIKVPLIIKYPGSKYRGTKVNNVVRIIDIIPAILEEAGIGYSKYKFDGKGILEAIKGDEKKERISVGFRFVYLINPDKSFDSLLIKISNVQNSFKLILNYEYPKEYLFPGFKVPGGPPFSVEETELFNLEKDPSELNNMAGRNRTAIRYLLEEMNPYYVKAKEIETGKLIGESAEQELKERLKALGYIQ